MLISPAFAQGAPAAGMDPSGLIMILVMFGVLYFMMIRPQMKRAKEARAMLEALAKGDEVITAGGIVGKISKIGDTYLTLEIGTNLEINVQKGAITTLLPKGTIKTL